LAEATKLHILDLSSNQITGKIAMELGNLSSLIQLYINKYKLHHYKTLELSTNNLSGSINPETTWKVANVITLKFEQK
jgi:Leucine-rich repeat (LRR) protein